MSRLAAEQATFDARRREDSEGQPHEGVGLTVPGSLYRVGFRPYPAQLLRLPWSSDDQVRKVQAGGWMWFQGHELRLPEALRGQSVVFPPTATDGCSTIRLRTDDVGALGLRDPLTGRIMNPSISPPCVRSGHSSGGKRHRVWANLLPAATGRPAQHRIARLQLAFVATDVNLGAGTVGLDLRTDAVVKCLGPPSTWASSSVQRATTCQEGTTRSAAGTDQDARNDGKPRIGLDRGLGRVFQWLRSFHSTGARATVHLNLGDPAPARAPEPGARHSCTVCD